jgi:hypothetical protein
VPPPRTLLQRKPQISVALRLRREIMLIAPLDKHPCCKPAELIPKRAIGSYCCGKQSRQGFTVRFKSNLRVLVPYLINGHDDGQC